MAREPTGPPRFAPADVAIPGQHAPALPRPAPGHSSPTATTASPTGPSREAQAAPDRRLVQAAKTNEAGQVLKLIRADGNVNAKDTIQDSAFLYAGAEGFNEVLRMPLANGAGVASTNRYGGTALIPASEHGHVETVRILLEAGVPVNRSLLAALAFNLVSWLQLAALPDGHRAKAWDIKCWRYRLFATAGKIITRARRAQLLLSESAPEEDLLKLLLENNARLNKGLVPSTG